VLSHPGVLPDGAASAVVAKGAARAPTAAEAVGVAGPVDGIPNEFVLGFYSERDREAFLAIARARGAEIVGLMDLGHAVRLRVKDDAALRALLDEGPAPVDYCLNTYVRSPAPPDTTRAVPETGYVGFGAAALAWLGVASATASWGEGITVAVLDSGVSTHDSLAGANVTSVDLATRTDGGGEYSAHGTAVASLIAGSAAGVSGLAPAADILSVKVVSEDGVGDAFTLALGIVEAVDRGADVINLCLGTYGNSFIMEAAVEYAAEHGVLMVAAAGNDALEGLTYPARYEEVVAVSACDATGRHLYFANRGSEVDLSAPGLSVQAAGSGDTLVGFSGTSAAVPFVSGALAAVLSEDESLSTSEALNALLANCDESGTPGKDDEFGQGLLNMQRIVNRSVQGLYDAAVCTPYFRSTSEQQVSVTVCAQNRGTEALERVVLTVQIGDTTYESAYLDLGVGETASREFDLDPGVLAAADGVRVVGNVEADGIDDSVPGNNTVSATLRLSGGP